MTTRPEIRCALAGAVVLTLLQANAWGGQRPEGFQPPTIRVSGKASLMVDPDEAVLEIGVTSREQTAGAAATKNSARVEAVLRVLRQRLGPQDGMSTIHYSVRPIYRHHNLVQDDYEDDDEEEDDAGIAYHPGARSRRPTIIGYSAKNIIRITTRGLGNVGELMDEALGAGANRIDSLQFRLADGHPARTDALRQATRQAMAKAEGIAAALDAKVGRVRLASRKPQRGRGHAPF